MNHSLQMLTRFVTLLRPIMESDTDFPGADAVDFIRDQYEAAIEAIAADKNQPRREQQRALDL